jgi:hypothetical protein
LHQLLHLVPRHRFENSVQALDGDRYVKTFSTWNQLTTLLYAQASGKDSLRDIENGLLAQRGRLYHLGLPAKIARSTLADANSNRDCRIFERLFYALFERCHAMAPSHKFSFKNPLFSIDSTVIDLCLASYPWAKFRKRKGALKLHYKLDHAGEVPAFMVMTDGKRHDLAVAKEAFSISPDSIYCFDKAYIDWGWFRRISDEGAYFVTRAKENLRAHFIGQQEIPKGKGVLYDMTITTENFYARKNYPGLMRLIGFRDPETGRFIEFLTNNFALSAATIAKIYKARWQIEIFFKWIKQNLKIKTFLGTSRNAVMTQIWIAMCYYLILAYIKFQARYDRSLFYLHRVIRETLLDKTPLIDLFNLNASRLAQARCQDQQLCLQL